MRSASAAAEFDAYVRARTPTLLHAAYLLTGDQHLAEDLVQTALVRTTGPGTGCVTAAPTRTPAR